MPYCLLQLDPVAPSADQLKRAFKALRILTEADAVKTAVEARGILVKNLSLDGARGLQRVLQSEGASTEVVDAAALPRPAEAKTVRRMEFQPGALAVYDPMGRAVSVPWQHIALLSAGAVRHFGLSASRTESKVTTFDPIRGLRTKVVTDVRHKVVDNSQFILELVLTGGATRFQIEAALFMFKYCFDRPELNLAQKLGLLIEMLAQQAPQAVLNHGAAALSCGGPGDWAYASKAALFDELTWHLWRMANNG